MNHVPTDSEYVFEAVEKKWQKKWRKTNAFAMPSKTEGQKYYVLGMWAYPSGDAHMGHVRNYTITDAVARYKRLRGYAVLHPTGWDAFGLPTENAAIKRNIDPTEWNRTCTNNMREQFQSLGFSYDWDVAIDTSHPEYYRWTQWLLIRFWKAGILYRAKKLLNWCPGCCTVLANEQVVEGKCERCKSTVMPKELEQWFLKMSDYAKRLADDTKLLTDWPKRIVKMQQHWIGNNEEGYKLHDWCISRQRYWGAPLPFVICADCGIQPVPEYELPVTLPRNIDITPGWPPPLARVPGFMETRCPSCGKHAERATDVMDTFVFSAWYYLRFTDPRNKQQIFDSEKEAFWCPIDLYVGGVEHATVHLIYSRFFHKVLYDLGLVSHPEPFKKLFAQGMVCLDGEKMSKSKGNIVSPVEIVGKYGADTLRLFVLFVGPPEQDVDWSEQGVKGCHRFLGRVFNAIQSAKSYFVPDWRHRLANVQLTEEDTSFRVATHQCIKKVTDTLEQDFRFNVAVAALMEFLNTWEDHAKHSLHNLVISEAAELLCLLLYPFAPHLAEELREQLGCLEQTQRVSWPIADDSLLSKEAVNIVVQINGKKKDVIIVDKNASEPDITHMAHEKLIERGYKVGDIQKTFFIPGKVVNFIMPKVSRAHG